MQLCNMKQIGIREFNTNISRFIKEAPLQLTRRHRVVATILPGEKKVLPNVATSEDLPASNVTLRNKVATNSFSPVPKPGGK